MNQGMGCAECHRTSAALTKESPIFSECYSHCSRCAADSTLFGTGRGKSAKSACFSAFSTRLVWTPEPSIWAPACKQVIFARDGIARTAAGVVAHKANAAKWKRESAHRNSPIARHHCDLLRLPGRMGRLRSMTGEAFRLAQAHRTSVPAPPMATLRSRNVIRCRVAGSAALAAEDGACGGPSVQQRSHHQEIQALFLGRCRLPCPPHLPRP